MSDQTADKLDAAISNKLANAMKGRDTAAYSPGVRALAERIMFAETAFIGIWEDVPEDQRNRYLREAAQRLG